MRGKARPQTNPGQGMVYQIRVRGHLGPQWEAWFGGVTLAREENGDTVLTGQVADQAALHGWLRKVRDLGLVLLSVQLCAPGEVDGSNADS